LQQALFDQYHFLNKDRKSKSLCAIFEDFGKKKPASGAGECAAPKLLHYAFKHGMKPLAIAEFWWGKSSKRGDRKHKNFYPACNDKCRPILAYMLPV
jgi:tRNA pseudouridine32 synthase/23S rRNA pseudouridine746 synthase